MQMTNGQRMKLIQHIYALIFGVPTLDPARLSEYMKKTWTNPEWSPWVVGDRACGRTFKNSITGLATLRGFDISLDIEMKNPNGTVKLLNLRFLEQNPDKLDGNGNLKENAILARSGHKIMWVIQNGIADGFLGKIQDGEWIPSRPHAYTQTYTPTFNSQQTGQDQYGANTQLNNGNWSSVPTIPQQNMEGSITAIMELADTDEECQWSGT